MSAAGALLHPWWREAWLHRRWMQMTTVRITLALAFAVPALAVGRLVSGPALRDRFGTAVEVIVANPGLVALLAGAGTWWATRRVTQSRLDALEQGWWRAAPVPAASLDVVVLAHALLIAAMSMACVLGATGALAWLGARTLPWPAMWAAGTAIVLGAGLAGLLVAWRCRHPPVAYRAGVRVPIWSPPWPRSSHAPHVFDWQRREALLRWRRGGSAWLVGIVVALTPGGADPRVVAGLVLMAGMAGWFGTVLHASGDVARDARATLRATPMSGMRLRRATLGYPVFALLATCGGFILGVALAGSATLPLWAAVAVLMSARGVRSLWHAGRTA